IELPRPQQGDRVREGPDTFFGREGLWRRELLAIRAVLFHHASLGLASSCGESADGGSSCACVPASPAWSSAGVTTARARLGLAETTCPNRHRPQTAPMPPPRTAIERPLSSAS